MAPDGHRPMISPEHAERVRRRHERALAEERPRSAHRGLTRDGWAVDHLTFRTTRPARTP
ncbi:hypothetical protein ACFQU9_37365 [Actinomadura namibiensis]|uniref:Uncharacterized protein n=1 Tax=Actinomadura namibiensis TaxID=182080 RepID=A0A7W3QJZ6_ACTNM|nr:methylase [Actinomadura namibiensis]MBA8949871.1 hypothetical protein [Actinomadura namibiensis]